ncbi:MAG TPA: DUF1707 domain-containing protein [Streptosporangiaceae bacterium]|jgi:hypothetical protein
MPEDHGPASAAGRGRLRASHADRDRVIEALKAAFVQGRLAKDEFDLRMNRTFGSRTYADLAPLTADLPAGPGRGRPGSAEPVRAVPPPVPVPADDPTRIPTSLGAGAWVLVWLGLLLIPGSLVTQFFLLMILGVLFVLLASPVAGGWVLQTWRERHAGGQEPPRATPGQPPGRDGTAGRGNQALPGGPRRTRPRSPGAFLSRAPARPASLPGATS